MSRDEDAQLRIVLPDLHVPFHDEPLLRCWMEHVAALEPDGIDIIGDLMDCYTISRYDKDPSRKHDLQDELDIARQVLRDIRHVVGPDCDVRYSEGNHEQRLTKLLWGNARALAPLKGLTMPKLLGLDELNIRYYPPATPYWIGNLCYTHGDVARKSNWSVTYGGSGAAAVSRSKGVSVLMGHTHQGGYVTYRDWDGPREGIEVPTMSKFALDYIVGEPPWNQGWVDVWHFPNGDFSPEFIRAVDQPDGARALYWRDDCIAVLPPTDRHVRLPRRPQRVRPDLPQESRLVVAPSPDRGGGSASCPPPTPSLIPVKEVARLLGISERTVWRHVKAGILPEPVRLGGATRWKVSDIEKVYKYV